MSNQIDPSAAVDRRAELEDDVFIGPYCVVGPQVRIGAGTRLESHVTLAGRVTLGRGNRLSPQVALGGEPQDLSYRGSPTQVIVGDNNVIREGVTINRGSEKENGITAVGNGCYLMANCHVAHDCQISDRVIIANGTLLGGHVHVHDDAVLSGNIGVHHFATIGAYAFIGGLSQVRNDVPPYMLVEGAPARPRCVNLVGLRRHNFPNEVISALAETHRLLFRERVGLDHAREMLREQSMLFPAVNHLLGFIQMQHEGRHGRSRERRRAA